MRWCCAEQRWVVGKEIIQMLYLSIAYTEKRGICYQGGKPPTEPLLKGGRQGRFGNLLPSFLRNYCAVENSG
jgi:hypothetical protein